MKKYFIALGETILSAVLFFGGWAMFFYYANDLVPDTEHRRWLGVVVGIITVFMFVGGMPRDKEE